VNPLLYRQLLRTNITTTHWVTKHWWVEHTVATKNLAYKPRLRLEVQWLWLTIYVFVCARLKLWRLSMDRQVYYVNILWLMTDGNITTFGFLSRSSIIIYRQVVGLRLQLLQVVLYNSKCTYHTFYRQVVLSFTRRSKYYNHWLWIVNYLL